MKNQGSREKKELWKSWESTKTHHYHALTHGVRTQPPSSIIEQASRQTHRVKDRSAENKVKLESFRVPDLQVIHFFLGISVSMAIGLPQAEPPPCRWTLKQPSNVEAGGVRNIFEGLMAHGATQAFLL